MNKKNVAVISGLVALGLGGGWFGYQSTLYKSGTVVAINQQKVKLTGLSKQQAKKALNTTQQTYKVKVNDRQTTKTVTVRVQPKLTDRDLKKIKNGQTSAITVGIPTTQTIVNQLQKAKLASKTNQPKNARLVRTSTNYTVKGGQTGGSVNYQQTAQRIITAIKQNKTNQISVKAAYQTPKITKTAMQAKANQLNKMIAQNLTVTVNNKTYTVPTTVKAQAVKQNGKINKTPLANWVTYSLSAKTGSYNHKIKFKTHNKKTITLTNTTAESGIGQYVPAKTTAQKLATALTTGQQLNVAAKLTGKKYEQNFNGTYIELDLTHQHAYMYKKGKLVVSWPFISGKKSVGHATITGVYHILYKDRTTATHKVHLRGGTADTAYDSVVNYWLPWQSSGYGIHDASWQKVSNFGKASVNSQVGSHGCINTNPTIMKKVYEEATVGMQVVSYGTLGQSL